MCCQATGETRLIILTCWGDGDATEVEGENKDDQEAVLLPGQTETDQTHRQLPSRSFQTFPVLKIGVKFTAFTGWKNCFFIYFHFVTRNQFA